MISHSGVAILTSGGDAPGMNAAVRAVIRYLAHQDIPVFAVLDGYEGLCKGGDMVRQFKWKDALGILSKGGTLIGTARCAVFKTREGRKMAARNLIEKKIRSLVVIGGDGSLTGASIFKREWPELVSELLKEKAIYPGNAKICSHLNIVGMVGSIDNDLCGTDMTIGTDTALHRIVDAIDCLASTAASHARTFIIEVMGRHCGYLALISAIAAPCDWVFVPEAPPPADWKEIMVKKMKAANASSKNFGLCVIAEGACELDGTPIKSDYVKQVLSEAGIDVRVTVLGHVQRGGRPTAYDRILGSRLGCEAANVIAAGVKEDKEIDPCIVSIKNNKVISLPLMPAIQTTLSIKECFKTFDFQRAQDLRGSSFSRKIEICKMLSVLEKRPVAEGAKHLNIGVAFIGAPAPGANAGIRALVKVAAYYGNTVTVFHEGVDGVIAGNTSILSPSDVALWGMRGGCVMGTTRTIIQDSNLSLVLEGFKKAELDCVVLFGGFEAVKSCQTLSKNVPFPVYLIPATISNNVPGSDFSVGCDTALNAVVNAVDCIKQSAASTRKRVFIIEVMGGNCGYLAVMGGLASGADAVYIPEQPVNIDELQCDAYRVMDKMNHGIHRGIIIRNENSSPHYKNDFVAALYAEEGHDEFVTRTAVLGHIQQGYSPSPFDRALAATLASKVSRDLVTRVQHAPTPDDVVVIGIRGTSTVFTPVHKLQMDTAKRVPLHNWWLELKPFIQTLALPPTVTGQKSSCTHNCRHCIDNQ